MKKYSPWVILYHKINPALSRPQLQMMYDAGTLNIGRVAELYCAFLKKGVLHESATQQGSDFLCKQGLVEVKGSNFYYEPSTNGYDSRINKIGGMTDKTADIWMIILVSNTFHKAWLVEVLASNMTSSNRMSFRLSADGRIGNKAWYSPYVKEIDLTN